MNIKITAALAGLMAAGAVTATATSASAYIVCNRAGDCWHTHYRPAYGPGYVRHDDDWYFHRDWDADHSYRWRRDWHDGRGYWDNGAWVPR